MDINIPCNVGDYVYRINFATYKIETKKVDQMQIHIGRDNHYLIHIEFEVCGSCRDTDFGKIVFKNRIDALNALDKYMNRIKK